MILNQYLYPDFFKVKSPVAPVDEGGGKHVIFTLKYMFRN